jgi:hypothetical protein
LGNKPDRDELITLAQAAEQYGFTHEYLRELCQRGRLKARKLGKLWVTTPGEMEKFIRSREARGVYRGDIKA